MYSNFRNALKQNLDELLSLFPILQLLTGDAIYLQRPLREALRERGDDYLFRVKDNQPDTMEALETSFAEERLDTPVKTVEKKEPKDHSSSVL
jgi:predicted transposase YbfD/YdcC